MLKNILWNLFEETGRVDFYLAYKEYQSRGSTYKHEDLTRTYLRKKCSNGDL